MPPSYVPADLGDPPLDFAWKGVDAHLGSTERESALLRSLDGSTSCAQLALCAGLLNWGAARLARHTDVALASELADALFVLGCDWRRVDFAPAGGKPPDQPPAESALRTLVRCARRLVGHRYAIPPGEPPAAWTSYYAFFAETFHAATLVRHIVGKPHKKAFDAWLAAVTARVRELASKPYEPFRKRDTFASEADADAFIARHRGAPLPPEVLDPARALAAGELPALVEAFLATLDPTTNRFVRS